jgi:hypothetical protein
MALNPLLTRRRLLLAKVETTAGVDAGPTAASDAILCTEAAFQADLDVIERNFYRNDISPLPRRIGRKLSKITCGVEFKSNGTTGSGTPVPPRLGRLLRACGFSETTISSSGAAVRALRPRGVQPVTVAWALGGTSGGGLNYYDYVVTVVKAGASGTAKVRVSEPTSLDATVLINEGISATRVTAGTGAVAVDNSDPLAPTLSLSGTWVVGDLIYVNINGVIATFTCAATSSSSNATDLATFITALSTLWTAAAASTVVTITYAGTATGVVVTTGVTAVALGASGGTQTPTWTGNLSLGQTWYGKVTPRGVRYKPTSGPFETVSLYLYMDGKLHKLLGAMGTFNFTATAAKTVIINFEFTGTFVDPIDAAMPAGAFDDDFQLPPLFQQAQFTLDGVPFAIASFTYTQNNNITPRSDANYADGYNGTRLTARNPQGGINPEDAVPGQYDFWNKLKNAATMIFSARIGQAAGNIVWIKAPNAQWTGMTYQDRDGLAVYDAGLGFGRETADDEIEFFFS